jgi:hypothetical protein
MMISVTQDGQARPSLQVVAPQQVLDLVDQTRLHFARFLAERGQPAILLIRRGLLFRRIKGLLKEVRVYRSSAPRPPILAGRRQ